MMQHNRGERKENQKCRCANLQPNDNIITVIKAIKLDQK